MMHLPSLAVLRSFEAAAKHQSFTAAAEELLINQAVISRQVREFEDLIGTALFRKSGRGVVLTPAGVALAGELHGGLERLRQTISKAQRAGPTMQTLTISALPTFSSHWLAPRLSDFRAQTPEATLVVQNRLEPFDMLADGIDIAIHYGTPEWVGGRLTPLCPEDLVPVAAPGLLERCGVTKSTDAIRLPLLHLTTRRNGWPVFFEENGLDPRQSMGGDQFDQFSTLIAAALAGLGAAIVPTYLIEREMAQGTLVPFSTPKRGAGLYYVVQPKSVENPLADRFSTWICAQAEQSTRRRGGAIAINP